MKFIFRSEEENVDLEKPTVTRSRSASPKNTADPVIEQKKKDAASVRKEKQKQLIQEKAGIVGGKIEPTLRYFLKSQSMNLFKSKTYKNFKVHDLNKKRTRTETLNICHTEEQKQSSSNTKPIHLYIFRNQSSTYS